MILAIHMPQWMLDFWTVYGDMITPILTTILTTVVTWLCLKLRTDAKLNIAKAELQINALKQVANREDNKPQLEEQSKQIEELKRVVVLMSDMFSLAFQSSELDPDIKSNIASITNKIKYGTEDDLVKNLEQENANLKEQLDAVSHELSQTKIVPASDYVETRQRTRR